MSDEKYTGKLGKRTALKNLSKPISLLESIGDKNKEENDRIFLEQMKTLPNRQDLFLELFQFFKLEENDWKGLAIELAHKHVPGFQFEFQTKKTGRKTTWDEFTLMGLFLDFTFKRKNLKEDHPTTSYSDSTIASRLAKNEWKGFEAKTLLNEYAKSKNSPLVKMWKKFSKTITEENFAAIFEEYKPNLIKVSRKLK